MADDKYDPHASQQFYAPLLSDLPRGHFESVVTVHDPQTGQAFIGLRLVYEIGREK